MTRGKLTSFLRLMVEESPVLNRVVIRDIMHHAVFNSSTHLEIWIQSNS